MTETNPTKTNDQIPAKLSTSTQTAPSIENPTTSTKRHSAVVKPATEANPNTSKTAIVALVLALFTCIAIGLLYYWQTLQLEQLQQRLLLQTEKNANNIQQQVNTKLINLLDETKKQVLTITEQSQHNNQEKMAVLENEIAQLRQNKPSDWLTHEAEYLLRVAARTIWLERDTTAAIGLLNDAEQRLKELNDPTYLSIRQLIHQDIETLKLVPKANSEEIVLALMAMAAQIKSLPLATVYIPESNEQKQSFELSENISDWRTNLSKTWQKILADFITVSRRTANVEPLMSPQYQQNLRENLALKIQLAQWAASENKTTLYVKTLEEVQLWLLEYFDMESDINKNFLARILELKSELVIFDHPNRLLSLQALQQQLTNKPLAGSTTLATPLEQPDNSPSDSNIDEKINQNEIPVNDINIPADNSTIKDDKSGDA